MADKPRFIAVRADVYNEMVNLIVNKVKMSYSKSSALIARIEDGSQAVTDKTLLSNNIIRDGDAKTNEPCNEEEETLP